MITSNECLSCGTENPSGNTDRCIHCGVEMLSLRSRTPTPPSTELAGKSDPQLPPVTPRPTIELAEPSLAAEEGTAASPATTHTLPPVNLSADGEGTIAHGKSGGPPSGKPPKPAPGAMPPQPQASLGAEPVAARYLASWGRRAAAVLLDTFYIWAVVGLLFLGSSLALRQALSSLDNWAVIYFGTQLILWLGSIIFGLAYGIFPYARKYPRKGQSPGKSALGIQVQRLDGTPLSGRAWFPRVLLSGFFVTITLGLYWVVDILWPLGDRNNQALHDKLASTVVVDLRERTQEGLLVAPLDLRPVLGSLAAGLAAIVFAVVGVAQLNSLSLGLDHFRPTTAMFDPNNYSTDYSEYSGGATDGDYYQDNSSSESPYEGSSGADDGSDPSDSEGDGSDGYDSSGDDSSSDDSTTASSSEDIGDAGGDERLTDSNKYVYPASSKSGQMEKVVRQHFQDRLEGKYHAAYAKYTYPLTSNAGTESAWSQAIAADGLQTIEFRKLETLSGDRVRLGLETNSDADGCHRWRILYQMVKVNGHWRMSDTTDTKKWAC